jgi:amino acid transporter
MLWKQLLARKSLETLQAEAAGENRLRRILGPISLTSLGIGAIIGAGIFVMTGRVAAVDAGPAVMLSFVVAGIGCVFAALCYAEFASMAPVAGSAYTYAYATLGEMLAWIIGWDLILEYAMACAVVAAGWTHYLDEFLHVAFGMRIPLQIASDPFTTSGAWFNLPAVAIIIGVTIVLVIGIRESATTNAILVGVKVGVVLFVIAVGYFYINSANWTGIEPADRMLPEELLIPDLAEKEVKDGGKLKPVEAAKRINTISDEVLKLYEGPPLTGAQARTRADKIKQQVLGLYWETAKLPDDVARMRIRKLTGEALIVYKVERKRDQNRPRIQEGSLTEAQAQKAIQETVVKTAVNFVSDLKPETGQAEQAAGAEFTTLLSHIVTDAAGRLKQEKVLTPAQAGAVVVQAVEKFTNKLARGRGSWMSEAEARARQAEARTTSAQIKPPLPAEQQEIERVLEKVREEAPKKAVAKWGLLGLMGLNQRLETIDDSFRSPFAPYGLSGIIFGASLVFFAYIGFDAISTHAEEAIRPQRDVPIGILASLAICTVLYILVSGVITGMEPYPDINQKAAVAAAFSRQAEVSTQSTMLNAAALLIAIGALAGLTSVLLITFLSQARIFLAMARDGLLPPRIFGAIHERFRTPHLSTMLTGGIIAVVAAFTPIADLEEMVNIGTLMAFVIVCGAVLLLRIRQPEAHRPFRTPLLYLLAPLGIVVNLIMMLFLPVVTWLRLVIWLAVGLTIYFTYGVRHSTIGKELEYRQSLRANGNGSP